MIVPDGIVEVMTAAILASQGWQLQKISKLEKDVAIIKALALPKK